MRQREMPEVVGRELCLPSWTDARFRAGHDAGIVKSPLVADKFTPMPEPHLDHIRQHHGDALAERMRDLLIHAATIVTTTGTGDDALCVIEGRHAWRGSGGECRA